MTSLETEVFAAERKWTVEGIPVLTVRIALPEPAGPENRLTRRIRRYYRAQCRAYLHYCGHQLFPQASAAYRAALAASAPLPCFRAELDFCVTYNENGFWSLYPQSREPGPDGRTLLRRWGDTWDLRTCGHLRLFPAPQRLEKKAAVPGRGGDPQPGGGGLRPVSSWLAAEAPQAFRSPEFLSH